MEWIDSAQYAALWIMLMCITLLMLFAVLVFVLVAVTLVAYAVAGFRGLNGITRDESMLALFVLPLVIGVGSSVFMLFLELVARIIGGR